MTPSDTPAGSAPRAADLIWKHLILSPPVDLELVSDWLGISVVFKPFPAEVPGMYTVTPRGRATIVLNSMIVTPRLRFTWAHEIGHHVLFGEAAERIQQDSLRGRDKKEMEQACDAFAANLLMPARLVAARLDAVRHCDLRTQLRDLKDTFGVSSSVVHRRLAELRTGESTPSAAGKS